MSNFGKLYIDRSRFRPGSLGAYHVAGAIIAVATALHLGLTHWVSGFPFITFFPAVIAVTLVCGSAAASLGVILSVLAAWLFIVPPDSTGLPVYQTLYFTIGSATVIALVGSMRSATAYVRRMNETLRVSEGKFRGLLESAPDAMVIVDDRHRIALVNAQAETLFGYRRAEMLGRPIVMLMPERHQAAYRSRLAAATADRSDAPTGRTIDLHGLRRDGTEFAIEVSVCPFRTEAGILVSSAVRDITERRQIEASLAEASKAKSDFLASMSHELRTPLNAIIGFSEMIRDAVMGPLEAQYREYAGDINQSGRHLQNIINDILDISKVEGGHLELREEFVSIGETAQSCRRIVASMAQSAGVGLSVDVPNTLPLIRSDQMRLKQILLNLMSNAVKFTPPGGSVTVSAWIDADGPVVAVQDTGIGMRAEDVAVALEPFRQIDGALSRRYEGTGLGLPLAKALVELHGGRLEIDSALGAGTTVRVHLPSDRVRDVAA